LLLAVGALLIYAAGVLVELVGEVFLARAVANAAWSFVIAAERVRFWKWLPRFLGWIGIVVFWGTVRALGYFSIGLFGASRWRMRLAGLSPDARATLDAQPAAVRDSIKQPLGSTADFGRKTLIDEFTTADSRRWARRQIDRPRDVLALVSAIVLSLIIAAFGHSSAIQLSNATRQTLEQKRADVQNLVKQLSAFATTYSKDSERPDPVLLHVVKLLEERETAFVEQTLPEALELPIEGLSLTKSNTRRAEDEVWETIGNLNKAWIANADSSRGPPLPELWDLAQKCQDASRALSGVYWTAADEISSATKTSLVVRITAAVAALFLYVAFFNTLSSTTASVIEALALQRARLHESARQALVVSNAAPVGVPGEGT